MLQYGCAELSGFGSNVIAAILKCYLTDGNAVTSQESFSLILSQLDVGTLSSVMTTLNQDVSYSDITENNKVYMLNAVLENLRAGNLDAGVMGLWFQEKLYSYLPAINAEILNCITSLSLSCDAGEAFITALDVAYSKLNQDTKEIVGSWISQFVQTRSCRQGSVGQSIAIYFKSFISNINVTVLQATFGATNLVSCKWKSQTFPFLSRHR
ncbi:uncharacterized protein RB166_015920 [Leptodactylus fuscus]